MANAAQLTDFYIPVKRVPILPDNARVDFGEAYGAADDLAGGNAGFYGNTPVLFPCPRGRLINRLWIHYSTQETDDSDTGTPDDLDLEVINYGNATLTGYNAEAVSTLTATRVKLLQDVAQVETAGDIVAEAKSDDGLMIYLPPYHGLFLKAGAGMTQLAQLYVWGELMYAHDRSGLEVVA